MQIEITGKSARKLLASVMESVNTLRFYYDVGTPEFSSPEELTEP